MGSVAAAAMLAMLMIRVVSRRMIQTPKAGIAPHGAKVRKAPAAVATPLPPLNPTQGLAV